MRLENRLAFITGGGRGIGRAIALAFAREGASIVVAARTNEQIENVANEATEQSAVDAFAIECDVADRESVKLAFERVNEKFSRGPDILVNNAGIVETAPFVKTDEALWERHLRVNLTGTYRCTRAALPAMLAGRWGRIINIASIAGKEGNPTLVPYSTAKAGVIGLTKALAKEVATKGITVNAVAPAVISTDLLQQMTKETVDLLISKIPMGRVGRPEEVAALVAWLASDECSFSTGAVYDLSGGRATY